MFSVKFITKINNLFQILFEKIAALRILYGSNDWGNLENNVYVFLKIYTFIHNVLWW